MSIPWRQALAVALCALWLPCASARAEPELAWVKRSEALAHYIQARGLVITDEVRRAREREIAGMRGAAKLQALYDNAADAYVASDRERAEDALAALASEAAAQDDGRYRTMSAVLVAYAPALDGDYMSARRGLEELLAGVTDPYIRAAGERLRSYALTDLGLVGNALEAARAGFRDLPIDAATLTLRAGLHDAMSYVSIRIGDDESGFDHLRQSIELDGAAGRPIDGISVAYNIATMLANAEQIPASLRVATTVANLSRARGGRQDRFFADLLCAKVSSVAGDFARTIRCADHGRAMAGAPAEYMTRLLVYRATALARMGEAASARAALDELREIAATRGDPVLVDRIDSIEPEVLRAEGRLPEAFDAMRQYSDRSQRDLLRRFNGGVKELRAALESDLAVAKGRAAEQTLKAALQKRSVEVLMLAAFLAIACCAAAVFIAVQVYRGRRAMIEAVCRAEEVLRGAPADPSTAPAESGAMSRDRLASILDEIERRDQEMRRIVEELKRARAAAEEANLAKSQFLATMSHELRTPLNAIIGYSELLRESAMDDGRATDVADIESVIGAGKALLTLINDLLDISKVEAGKMELAPEEFNVAGLVLDTASIVKPAAQENNNRLHIEVSPDAGAARSDPFRLGQCLLNLLSNAVKFTKDGEVTVRVRRERQSGEDWLVFDVIDTGIGISDEQMDRMFQPFSQADSSTTRAFGGSGLGLAITRRLARLLGGDVSVTSEFGVGSVFTLRVRADIVGASGTAEIEAFAPAEADAPLVIVIDDDASARDLSIRVLSRAGFAVRTESSASAGMALVAASQPALVVLDINLPDRSGWNLISEIIAVPGAERIPVLVVSVEDDRARALRLGARDFLTKPVDRDTFVAAVSACALHRPPGDAAAPLLDAPQAA